MMYEIASSYARALFNLTSSAATQEKRLNTLEQIMSIINTHPAIIRFFSSSKVESKLKKQLLEKYLGTDVDSQMLYWFFLLIEKKRFKLLPLIVQKYSRLVKKGLQSLEARLMTPIPLNTVTKDRLKEKLEKIYKKKIEIKEEINPEIMGGGILLIDHQMIDFSVNRKLNKLRENLQKINV